MRKGEGGRGEEGGGEVRECGREREGGRGEGVMER